MNILFMALLVRSLNHNSNIYTKVFFLTEILTFAQTCELTRSIISLFFSDQHIIVSIIIPKRIPLARYII